MKRRLLSIRRTPHPVIVTIRDNGDYIGVLLCSYYTTITGWGVLLSYRGCGDSGGAAEVAARRDCDGTAVGVTRHALP